MLDRFLLRFHHGSARPHVARVVSVRCSWCHRFRLDDAWLSRDELTMLGLAPHVQLTHGVCAPCLEKLRLAT